MHTFLVGSVCAVGGVTVGVIFSGKIAAAVKDGLLRLEATIKAELHAIAAAIKSRV
jgi:hypothetical protein